VFLNFVYNLPDVDSLGIVNLRYCWYVAAAKVNNIEKIIVNSSIKPADITDQPEGVPMH
jgi:protein TIF31